MRLHFSLLLLLLATVAVSHELKNPCMRRSIASIVNNTPVERDEDMEEHAQQIQSQLHKTCGGDWGVIVLKKGHVSDNVFYSISATDEKSVVHTNHESGMKYIVFGVNVKKD
ncbi:hypothetical protein QR680_007283 [Steinernema hermaphroditum]|uniref:Uncharacterized protein n=1 Tax=Steinernema hermaphroditum TaxID=289476 RepID=A0AA39HZX1_9BILA|nr:hypothetical protein QR680_007283 [Steinernema hermaphroditum]